MSQEAETTKGPIEETKELQTTLEQTVFTGDQIDSSGAPLNTTLNSASNRSSAELIPTK